MPIMLKDMKTTEINSLDDFKNPKARQISEELIQKVGYMQEPLALYNSILPDDSDISNLTAEQFYQISMVGAMVSYEFSSLGDICLGINFTENFLKENMKVDYIPKINKESFGFIKKSPAIMCEKNAKSLEQRAEYFKTQMVYKDFLSVIKQLTGKDYKIITNPEKTFKK